MKRAYRLSVAWLAWAALALLSCRAMAQPRDWPPTQWLGGELTWRGQQPDIVLPPFPSALEDDRPSIAEQLDNLATQPGSDGTDIEPGVPAQDGFEMEDPGCGGMHAGPFLDEGVEDNGNRFRLFGRRGPRYRFHGRHRGHGEPLVRESWLYRPFSAGWMMGLVEGGQPTSDWRAGQQQGFQGTVLLGWDHNYYFGGEMRFSFDSMNATMFAWDLDLLYYPWGDSRWRPYLMAGAGAGKLRLREGFSPSYDSGLSSHYNETLFVMPFAVGVKYLCNEWFALRSEIGSSIVFGEGNDLKTMANFTFLGGIELRFGGHRKSYWPWNPGRHYW